MRNVIKRVGVCLLTLLMLLPTFSVGAVPSTLTVVKKQVQFPSSDPVDWGTYEFALINQSGTGTPLFCVAPEIPEISSNTYTHKGVLTQAVINNTTWSHENGTKGNYAKPTANEIYSILWHAVHTEGLDFDDLTDWQQGGIQMAIKHWREKNSTWGVPACMSCLRRRPKWALPLICAAAASTKPSNCSKAPICRYSRSRRRWASRTTTISAACSRKPTVAP